MELCSGRTWQLGKFVNHWVAFYISLFAAVCKLIWDPKIRIFGDLKFRISDFINPKINWSGEFVVRSLFLPIWVSHLSLQYTCYCCIFSVKGNLDDEEEHKRIQRQGNYGTGSTMHYFLSTQPPEAGRLQALLHSDSHWYCTPGTKFYVKLMK
jgi:hypothetical protein